MTQPTSRLWRTDLLRFGGSVAILAILALLLPVGEILRQMRLVPISVWLATLACFMMVQLFGALKFHLLLHSAGAGLPFALSLRCYFAALFGNVFLPSIIGGDVVSIGLAMRYSQNRPGVALGALVNRSLDFIALAFMTVVGTILLHATLDPRSRRVFWSVAAALSAIAMIGVLVVTILARRRYSFRMRRRLSKIRRAGRAMRQQKGTVAVGLAMGVVAQCVLVFLVAGLGRSAGLHLSASVWLFAWPLSKLAALAPVSLGGIGAREAAFAAILVPFGVAATRSVAVGLLYEAISLTGGLLAGLISWAIARGRAADSRRGSGPVAEPEPDGAPVA